MTDRRTVYDLLTEWDLHEEARGTLYHGTSEAAARKIAEDGYLEYGHGARGGKSPGFEALVGRTYLTANLLQAVDYGFRFAGTKDKGFGLVVVRGNFDAAPDEDVVVATLIGSTNDQAEPVKLTPKLEKELFGLALRALNYENEHGEPGIKAKPIQANEVRRYFRDTNFGLKRFFNVQRLSVLYGDQGVAAEDEESYFQHLLDVARRVAEDYGKMSPDLLAALSGHSVSVAGKLPVDEVWLIPRNHYRHVTTYPEVKQFGKRIR